MNLLSPASKENWHKSFQRRELAAFFIAIILLEIALAVGIYFIRLEIQRETNRVNLEVSGINQNNIAQRRLPIDAKTREVNTLLALIKRNLVLDYSWPSILTAIDQAVPPGLTFRDLKINLLTHQLTLSGHAQTRDQLLIFQDHLRSLATLSDVAAPITNILRSADIDFSLTANLIAQQ